MDFTEYVPPPAPPPPQSVANRFVSTTVLDTARATRAEEWKAMHEKLGQEAPPLPPVDGEDGAEPYDGRSLWEKLQVNKDKKQEAFEEQIKFKNQFRSLDSDEISFLDSLVDDNFEEEDRKRAVIKGELEDFRRAVIGRSSALPPPVVSPPITTPEAGSSTAPPTATGSAGKSSKKRDFQKSFLAGVVVKKKKAKGPSKLSESTS